MMNWVGIQPRRVGRQEDYDSSWSRPQQVLTEFGPSPSLLMERSNWCLRFSCSRSYDRHLVSNADRRSYIFSYLQRATYFFLNIFGSISFLNLIIFVLLKMCLGSLTRRSRQGEGL